MSVLETVYMLCSMCVCGMKHGDNKTGKSLCKHECMHELMTARLIK